ncbi:UDP-N-acetyl-D-mannosamine dehydrogenase [Aliiglaciecola lipolytica]|uniref:UDP-N-acetyl-D-mannosaminuronic acid dehydrogenase n=1 Tax=Aliiglaciecola lipolytica E3 TaxID=1127673 RepID=K6Y9N8_9ALTE|nr:UDP-N-acetyl-D-mannosamine dehydrogenase [Aliiglaciecola lipolytica]GAC13358.1 UDP-N-acetyl-D-mannosaminuronic acid dehydrogenase [Aliiglaciecola lipolytica E3]
MTFTKLSVIGLGYIGLPTAAVFASRKLNVVGVDVNPQTVDIINEGGIHIVEPDLDMVVHAAVNEGYLRATLTPEESDAYILAVPTPFKDNHSADLSYIESAAKAIAPVLKSGNLVILESTSPVGATEKMADWLAIARPDLTFPQQVGEQSDIRIAHCPERVLPGHVLRELVENDRVIGGMTPKCSEAAISLYKCFVQGDCVVTNARTAEMAKLTENSFRDVNIAFANELSMICDDLDINVWELIALANRHPRVNILQPGAGVGGHCIAVDPWFIVDSAPDKAKIIKTAREVNDSKPEWVLEKITEALNEWHKANPTKSRSESTVAIFGVAFKPDIDDLRESPALEIAKKVSALGCQTYVVEPNIDQLPESLEKDNVSLVDIEKGLTANVVGILVKHKTFNGYVDALKDVTLVDAVGLTNLNF